ncbi:glycosyltransferase [mine drainage metagenome]|uniref:Glycosyltransferase n=1 Tax=mine drainage metagenome TaxID=410659 RepID=T0YUN7_9ZZZZ
MVPCRNVDFTLRENLNSLKNQRGVKYDIIAIVDSKNDPSLQIINEIGIKYIITDFDCKGCSGKVRALSTALSRFKNYSLYVIADSDILPKNDWLEKLTSPFSTPEVGVSTTFPYFKAMGGFWSKVKTLWGFVGQGMMESDLTRFGWGGHLPLKKNS